jgi:hypothetical protein
LFVYFLFINMFFFFQCLPVICLWLYVVFVHQASTLCCVYYWPCNKEFNWIRVRAPYCEYLM